MVDPNPVCAICAAPQQSTRTWGWAGLANVVVLGMDRFVWCSGGVDALYGFYEVEHRHMYLGRARLLHGFLYTMQAVVVHLDNLSFGQHVEHASSGHYRAHVLDKAGKRQALACI